VDIIEKNGEKIEICQYGNPIYYLKPFNIKKINRFRRKTDGIYPGIWGLMDAITKKIVFEAQFLYLPEHLFSDKIMACRGDGWKYNNEKKAYCSESEKWGIISLDGRVLLPFEYEKITYFISNNDCFLICKKDKYGVLNSDLKVVIPFEFDDINSINSYDYYYNHDSEVLLKVKKDKQIEIRNTDNLALLPRGLYNRFESDFAEDQIVVYKKDHQSNRMLAGIYNFKLGKEVVKTQYENLMFFDAHYLNVITEDEKGNHNDFSRIITDNGEIIKNNEYDLVMIEKNHNGIHPEYKYKGFDISTYDINTVYFNITKDNSFEGIVDNMDYDNYSRNEEFQKEVNTKIKEEIEKDVSKEVDTDYTELILNNLDTNVLKRMNEELDAEIDLQLTQYYISTLSSEAVKNIVKSGDRKLAFIKYLKNNELKDEVDILRQAYVIERRPLVVVVPSRSNCFNLSKEEINELDYIISDMDLSIEKLKTESDGYVDEDLNDIYRELNDTIMNTEDKDVKAKYITIKNKVFPEIIAGVNKTIIVHLLNGIKKAYSMTSYNLNRIVGQKTRLLFKDGSSIIGFSGFEFLDDDLEDCVTLFENYDENKGFYDFNAFKLESIMQIDCVLDFNGDINFEFNVKE